MPGSKVSSTMRTSSEADQRRRRGTVVMISMRSEGLVIETIVCLTLAKWETVSGQFGGYFSKAESHLNSNLPVSTDTHMSNLSTYRGPTVFERIGPNDRRRAH
jgi:hypothetical protein